MNDEIKVRAKITSSLRFFYKQGYDSVWHVKLFTESALMNVPENLFRRALIWLADRGFVKLTTWSNALWREAYYSDFPTLDDFFHNPDDSNYVRVEPLVSF